MTDETERIKEKFRAYKEDAALEMDIIREMDLTDTDALHDHLYIYVKRKYMLDDEECESDVLMDLIHASLDKSLKAPKGSAEAIELASGCGGVSSAVTKKILLLMVIQKELSIKFDPESVPNVKTVRDLALLIRERRKVS